MLLRIILVKLVAKLLVSFFTVAELATGLADSMGFLLAVGVELGVLCSVALPPPAVGLIAKYSSVSMLAVAGCFALSPVSAELELAEDALGCRLSDCLKLATKWSNVLPDRNPRWWCPWW